MSTPRVWVLLGKGTGGNHQMLALADALGWPYEAKQIVYNLFNHLPNPLLGASLAGVDRRRSAPLRPPWPDLVIAASRRSAPVALWIKKQSGGRTRLVHLLHAMAPLDRFDLVITLPQYRLPRLPNVLHNVGPLNRIDPARLAEAAERLRPKLEGLARPYTGVLVGGSSSSYVLDRSAAERLGREASRRAEGGALLVTTSPRTPAAAADALFASIDVPVYAYRWRPNDPDNPYLGILALADRFIVTVDSASLAIEACQTGKPVEVFEWPRRRPLDWRARRGGHPGLLGRAYDRLVYWGFIKPPRNFDAFHAELRRRGLTRRLGDPPANEAPQPLDDMERALERIRALFARERELV